MILYYSSVGKGGSPTLPFKTWWYRTTCEVTTSEIPVFWRQIKEDGGVLWVPKVLSFKRHELKQYVWVRVFISFAEKGNLPNALQHRGRSAPCATFSDSRR